MKKQFRLPLSILALVCLCPAVAFANPTSLDLSFNYTPRGKLAVDVKFDEPSTTRCTARHRISLYYEGQEFGDKGIIRKSVYNRRIPVGRKSTSLRAKKLLGVKQLNEKDPILAIQTRLICKKQEIDSNTEARFIKCGTSTKRVSISRYFKNLKKAVR